MTEEHAGAWTHTSRIIRALPEELYEAFIDPAALVAWLPPAEMTGVIHEFDARVGGGYRMSLFYPSNINGMSSDPRIPACINSPRGNGQILSCTPWKIPVGT